MAKLYNQSPQWLGVILCYQRLLYQLKVVLFHIQVSHIFSFCNEQNNKLMNVYVPIKRIAMISQWLQFWILLKTQFVR